MNSYELRSTIIAHIVSQPFDRWMPIVVSAASQLGANPARLKLWQTLEIAVSSLTEEAGHHGKTGEMVLAAVKKVS